MSWSTPLNPAPWRDDDQDRRIGIEAPPPSGLAAVLRSNFCVAPLPADLQKMLDKLR